MKGEEEEGGGEKGVKEGGRGNTVGRGPPVSFDDPLLSLLVFILVSVGVSPQEDYAAVQAGSPRHTPLGRKTRRTPRVEETFQGGRKWAQASREARERLESRETERGTGSRHMQVGRTKRDT